MRSDLQLIIREALKRVEPSRLVLRALAKDDPTRGANVRLLSVGKAASAMAAGAVATVGPRIVAGLVIGQTTPDPITDLVFLPGGHPLPNAESERAGRAALAFARETRSHEALLLLLSGGASAMMAAPSPGISLDDKVATTARLMESGADISSLNIVRKHLSVVKGGELARASPSGCHTLAISDVVGDELGVIGSGPGVPDDTTFADALEVLQRFGGLARFPAAVVDRLERGASGDVRETLKPGETEALRVTARVIGSRRDAMDGACHVARELGYEVTRIDEPIVGEAREAARGYIARVTEVVRSATQRFCIVSSGETTVHVVGTGKGGRNQEFALAAARHLPTLGAEVVLASLGTDGVDGPTDAAGALADPSSVDRARARGLDPDELLATNDSFRFFDKLGDLIRIGPTGTNVGDLQILVGRLM